MDKEYAEMKKKAWTALMAGVITAGMVMTISASGTSPEEMVPAAEGTDIYAGILLKDQDAKVRVKVPTLFAFVVNGSVSSAETGAVTSGNGGILLPNVKVKVESQTGTAPAEFPRYTIETVGQTTMNFENYSTIQKEDRRVGLEVLVRGTVVNEGTDAARNNWSHISDAAMVAGDANGFKQYTLSVDGKDFSQSGHGTYTMEEWIRLAAPELGYDGAGAYSNMDAGTKLALAGTATSAGFDVAVGGQRNQYSQVEESVKIGTISWTVSATLGREGIYTAPNNEYLDGIANPGDDTDPDNIELQ